MSRPPAACGTLSGYKRHRRLAETACDKCKAAAAAYQRSRYVRHSRPPAACGTHSGYQRHRRLAETACDRCKAAWAAYQRARRARRTEVGP